MQLTSSFSLYPATECVRLGASQSNMPIPYSRQWITQEDIDAVVDVLLRDFVTQGPKVAEFEHALTEITGSQYAVAVNNGTAALHLAVAGLGVISGYHGITTPITFTASAACFLYQGATVSFVDVDARTGLMDVHSLEKKLKNEAKRGVIIPVSLQGRVPDLYTIYKISQDYGWQIVEDAAHSLGSTYRAGGLVYKSASCAHSNAAILSFHPAKHICSCEGGAILTNDANLASRLRLLRSHGVERPGRPEEPTWLYEQSVLGYNYRMNEMQAALGLSQLSRLDSFLERRRALATRYYEAFSERPFCETFAMGPQDSGNSYHLFVIHFKDQSSRNEAHEFLKDQGILTQVHYRPLTQFPLYKYAEPLAGAEAYYEGCLSIPLFPKMTDKEQGEVIETIRAFCLKQALVSV